MKRKRTTDPEEPMMFTASPPAPTPASVLTPSDIQSKEFRVARMGGYRMRDVDEFLDQVTDAMSGLMEENERLRGSGSSAGGIGRDASELRADVGAEGAVASTPDASVRAFLQKEKDFLRSLGSLVQGHAEEMKGMARAARPGPTPAPAPPDPAVDEPPPSAPDPEATAAMSRDELEVDDSEPISVGEPEPAASRSDEGKPEGSLRDLFWGEES